MKSLLKFALLPLMALTIAAAPWANVKAQQNSTAQGLKPVAIVSLASIKENLADIGYVTRAAGMADYGDTAKFFASALTSGIDKDRPIGLYFITRQGDVPGILFAPVEPNGLATFLKVQKEQLGEPKDVGGGILQLGLGKTVFVKEQNGWAFAAENKDDLVNLPQDPLALLGDLPQKYNVAGKLIVRNVPDELRRTVTDEIKLGMERFLDSPAARQGNLDREQARQLTKSYLNNIEKLVNEADELMIGLGIDEAKKHVTLDIGFSGKDGTSLARSMAMQVDAKTNFAGFAIPDASVTLGLASKVSQEDTAQVGVAMKAARAQWAKQIDDSPDIPAEKREPIKAVLGPLFDVIEKTVATGRIDGGAALVLLPKSVSFAFGGAVADGSAVEKVLRSLVDLGKDIPNFPKLQLNVGSIGDVKLHRLSAPIPESKADIRELLGENLEILFGIGPQSMIVTGGKNAEALLRKVLERSALEKEKPVMPLSINVSLLPILKFSKSIDENPIVNNLIRVLEQAGNDRVTISNQPGPRSSVTHVEVQEGVIKAIGEGVKGATARFNRAGR